jgi:hypothetical protein
MVPLFQKNIIAAPKLRSSYIFVTSSECKMKSIFPSRKVKCKIVERGLQFVETASKFIKDNHILECLLRVTNEFDKMEIKIKSRRWVNF